MNQYYWLTWTFNQIRHFGHIWTLISFNYALFFNILIMQILQNWAFHILIFIFFLDKHLFVYNKFYLRLCWYLFECPSSLFCQGITYFLQFLGSLTLIIRSPKNKSMYGLSIWRFFGEFFYFWFTFWFLVRFFKVYDCLKSNLCAFYCLLY